MTNALLQWGEDKPTLLALFARIVAYAAEPAHRLLEKVSRHDEALAGLGDRPPLDQWLRLYRSHRRVLRVLAERALSASGIRSVTADELREMTVALAALSDAQAAELFAAPGARWPKPPSRTLRRLVTLMRLGERDSRQWMNPATRDHYSRALVMDERPLEPEVQFFFLVWLPCWLVSKDTVPRVLRRARNGNLQALDVLLRIDKDVMYEPRIGALIRTEARSPRRARYARIVRAIGSSELGVAAKRPKLKLDLLGLLAEAFSEAEAVQSPELRDLADAAAAARSAGAERVDADLPAAENTLRQGILRSRRQWTDARQK